ncbi:hypothetical protein Nepgr_017311 [Nepenthes gracilis]|uniref:Uncharacterized protein n=1 Tax=Nepenthes gracilis TaxID=150966 RepID=A0AAD3SP74_NEPGR|nr:hypothetical protein Nepgr_017311 [Nepenthes gracilis]
MEWLGSVVCIALYGDIPRKKKGIPAGYVFILLGEPVCVLLPGEAGPLGIPGMDWIRQVWKLPGWKLSGWNGWAVWCTFTRFVFHARTDGLFGIPDMAWNSRYGSEGLVWALWVVRAFCPVGIYSKKQSIPTEYVLFLLEVQVCFSCVAPTWHGRYGYAGLVWTLWVVSCILPGMLFMPGMDSLLGSPAMDWQRRVWIMPGWH